MLYKQFNRILDKLFSWISFPERYISVLSNNSNFDVNYAEGIEHVQFTEREILLIQAFNESYPTLYYDTNGVHSSCLYTLPLRKVILSGYSGLIFDKINNGFIIESGMTYIRMLKAKSSFRKTYPVKAIDNLCTSIHLYPWARKNIYHWFIECLPRLIQIREVSNSYSQLNILIPNEIPNYQEQTIEILKKSLPSNVKIIRISPNCNYFLESYLFLPFVTPDMFGFLPSRISKELSSLLIEGFGCMNDEHIDKKMIYISRRKAKKRRISNETELLRAIESKYDIEIHTPEDYHYAKQVKLFATAKTVISAHGAGLTNILFCEEGTRVIELMPSNKVKLHYFGLAKSKNLDYLYILGSREDSNNDFKIDPNDLLKLLGR